MYLDNGGCLFISGNELVNNIDNPTFLNNYLHTSYVGYPYLYEVLGINGDPISDGMTLPLSNYGQEIDPISPAVPIFTYNPAATSPMSLPDGYQTQQADIYGELINQYLISENISDIFWMPDIQVTSIQSSGTAGVRVDTGTFRLVFLPFEFDSVRNASDRAVTMERVMNWLSPTEQLVDLSIQPSEQMVAVGDNFTVAILAEAGDLSVSGISAYLNYDPAYLEVQSVTPGADLPLVLENSFDNITGTIGYSAGKLGEPFPSGNFTVATIEFQALALTSPSTAINFSTSLPIVTSRASAFFIPNT